MTNEIQIPEVPTLATRALAIGKARKAVGTLALRPTALRSEDGTWLPVVVCQPGQLYMKRDFAFQGVYLTADSKLVASIEEQQKGQK